MVDHLSGKQKEIFACPSPDLLITICNHGPPTPGAGRGIAVEMSSVFTFALSPQCGGNTRDLCYIGKKGGAMKTYETDCGGKLPWFYQLTDPAVWGL